MTGPRPPLAVRHDRIGFAAIAPACNDAAAKQDDIDGDPKRAHPRGLN